MAVIKVDGYDLYSYTRVAPGEGLDIADTDFLDPQFSDSAVGFGDQLINVQAKNRELVVPVHLKSATGKDGLHALVSDLNRRLSLAQQLEWKDDGATNSSWLKIQFARFEPEFNKRRQDAGWMSGVVRIYTEPYAKSVASGYAYSVPSFAGTGIMASYSIASYVKGDAPVTSKFTFNTPSTFNAFSHGRILAGAILPASYVADWPAASIIPMGSSVLVGASGAAGSQLLVHTSSNVPVTADIAATSWTGQYFGKVVLTCASAYAGNNRVLAVCAADFELDVYMVDDNGQARVRGVATTYPWYGQGTVDLGVIKIDPTNGATQTLTFATSRRNFTYNPLVRNASSVFEMNRIVILPEDSSFMVVDDSRRRPLSLIEGDRTSAIVTLDAYGNTVTASGAFQLTGATGGLQMSSGNFVSAAGASPYSGVMIAATAANISGYIRSANLTSDATAVMEIGKHTLVGDWSVRYERSNGSLAGLSVYWKGASGGIVSSVVASVGIGFAQEVVGLRLKQQGPVIAGELYARFYQISDTYGRSAATVIPMATISASVGELSSFGTPFIALRDGGGVQSCQRAEFSSIPSTGLRAGDVYTISTEERKALRTNGNVYDVGFGMRGDFPSFPPATKYVAAAAFILPLDRSDGLNQAWSAAFDFNEQFTYSK